MKKSNFQQLLLTPILLLIFFLLTSCGTRDENAGSSRPSNLSSFSSFETIGNPSDYVNISGATTGSMSRKPFSATINGANVEVVISGSFIYSIGSSGGAELSLFSKIATIGGLNDPAVQSSVTIEQAVELLSITIVEQEIFELEFAQSPFPNSNLGTYESIKTNEDGSQVISTGTFQFNSTSLFNENDINTN
jgi:hypothetical protein